MILNSKINFLICFDRKKIGEDSVVLPWVSKVFVLFLGKYDSFY